MTRPAQTSHNSDVAKGGQKTPQRILIIRPSALGDVCRSLCMATALKAAYPGVHIAWIVRDTFVDAVRGHPDVDTVIPFPRNRFKKLYNPKVLAEFMRWVWALKRAKYDIVIDAQGLARSALMTIATCARRRIGYADAREFGRLALNERIESLATQHTVDRMMDLACAAGAPRQIDLTIHPPADAKLPDHLTPETLGRYLVLAPTSIWNGKRWPEDRFTQLIDRVLDPEAKLPIDSVVIVGAPHERGQINQLVECATRNDRVIDAIGATSIGQLMRLVSNAALVIANDSAVLHMAVGFDRPIVALYGPTNTQLVGPYNKDGDVIQHITESDALNHKAAHVGEPLMQRITVEEVFEASRKHLQRD